MRRDDATEAQVRAAQPSQSTWLSANAGSGKTRVLTDRVARLLLDGTDPGRILCLTYTKAAASEMQNRLFRRLGEWAMLPEQKLRGELRALGVDRAIDADTLARARRLFARAIETPGGLKIQTIHSFCASLLRRFPIEAGISPAFRELDDRSARLIRQDILEEIASGPEREIFDAVAAHLSGDDPAALLDEICRNAPAFAEPADRARIAARLGLPPDMDREALIREVFAGGEAELLGKLVPVLLASGTNDRKAGERLAPIIGALPGIEAMAALETVLLTGKGAKEPFTARIGAFPTKAVREREAGLMRPLEDLMRRIERGRPLRLGLMALERAEALHRFARLFLDRYHARKAQAGWVDFDDLIARAAALLSDPSVAAWVLFRLDGGIDHILVDEAQDTSPAQWQVIERLAEEFTAGHGAREVVRTIFVVGDKKQSIYSFQGADLAAFDRMRDHFARKHAAARVPFQQMELLHSFRSSRAVLDVVDSTFDDRVRAGLGGAFRHIAFRSDMPGRVDLWPAIPKAEKPEEKEWYDPTDILPEDHHTVRLARRIAAHIRGLIDAGTQIPQEDGTARPVHEGDFLILVQRRSDLFHELIRACKACGLAVAGADRLRIGGELAVRDLLAVLRFLATPEDDLSLAEALRSPLLGLSEAQLYDLAHGRDRGAYLWQALRARQQDFPDTVALLRDLRDRADFLRPFEILERILTRHDGRRRLIARLGSEAEEGIDALLSQALAYEQAEVPSLTGFLVWMQTGEVEIKRQLDSASRALRVMTVHGAKGLEAPIVILPDTAKPREDVKDQILDLGGLPMWKLRAADSPQPMIEAREEVLRRQREERMRLLYVAMTRARVWLIVCGAGEVGQGADSWYSLVAEGVERAGAARAETDLPPPDPDAGPNAGPDAGGSGPVLRHEHGSWPAPALPAAPAADGPTRAPVPDWVGTPAPAPVQPEEPVSPSALEGAKALPGEDGRDEETAKRRGTALHRLLEHLPDWPVADWPDVAAALIGPDLSEDETAEILAEARRVLDLPEMAPLLSSDALAEVELCARLPQFGNRLFHGTIDRLLVTPERVLAVDFKSNAVVPDRPDTVPPGILRQMGAYAAMLERIWPGRRVETAILWTRTGQLMPLDPDIVRQALACTPIP